MQPRTFYSDPEYVDRLAMARFKTQQPTVKPQAPQKKKGRGGWLSSLISEVGGTGGALGGAATGAALGSVVPGIGNIIGGIAGGVIGGFGGGTAGRLVENKVRDDEYRLGDALKEGALSGAFGGLGGGLRAAKGVKALQSAGSARSMASRGIGAFEPKEGLRAIPNATARVKTAQEFGIKSGYKGLKQATANMASLEDDLVSKLSKTKIPVSRLSGALDNIGQTSSAGMTTPSLNRSLAGARQAITNAAKDGKISAVDVRNIRSKVGKDIFKGTSTASKEVQQEIYRAYGDIIGKASPGAKQILNKQHRLLDLAPGLAERTKDATVPFLGTRVKVPGLSAVRDRGIDTLARTGDLGRGKVAQVAKGTAVRGLANQIGQPTVQDPIEQDLQTQEEAPLLSIDEQIANMGGFGQQQELPQESQSSYSLSQAIADLENPANANPKIQKQIMDRYDFISKAEQTQAKASGQTANQKTASAKAQGAENIINELENVFNNSGGARGPIAGRVTLAGALAGGGNQRAKSYADLRSAYTAQISRALGEVGVLTDKDREVIQRAIPSVNDSKEAAQIKLGTLRNILALLVKGSTDTSNEDALYQGLAPYINQGGF